MAVFHRTPEIADDGLPQQLIPVASNAILIRLTDRFVVPNILLAHPLDIGAYVRTFCHSIPLFFMYSVNAGTEKHPTLPLIKTLCSKQRNDLLLHELNDDIGGFILNRHDNWPPCAKKEEITTLRGV